MIRQMFTCDKCKKDVNLSVNDVPQNDMPYQIVMTIASGLTPINYQHPGQTFSQHWCRKCMNAAGFVKHGKATDIKDDCPPTPLTYDEKFLGLLEELGVMFHD